MVLGNVFLSNRGTVWSLFVCVGGRAESRLTFPLPLHRYHEIPTGSIEAVSDLTLRSGGQATHTPLVLLQVLVGDCLLFSESGRLDTRLDLPDTAEKRLFLHALLSERICRKKTRVIYPSQQTQAQTEV